ncbi:hypothetical protein AgCh_005574 [Apium graveolens]
MRKTVVSNEPAGGKKRKNDLEYIAKDKYPRTEKNPDSTPKKGGPGQKFTEYAKLNAPRSQILMEIEKERDIRWPKPLKADPTKPDKRKYCRFHKDDGHDTDECRQLKDEIEFLIRKGRLSKYTGEGGYRNNNGRRNFEDRRRDQDDHGRNPQPRDRNSRKAYTREVMHIVGEAPKRARTGVTMTFDDSDLEGVKFHHDDPLVITPIIGNSPVKMVLIDNHSSMDILLHDTFLRMGYNDSQLTPTDMPIYGFAGVECPVEGIIRLPTTVAADMPGINPELITHKLNVDPNRKTVKQKKRSFAPERQEAIKQEVEKLLEAGFIEEIQFPECFANPVMVKKANEKWRMCVNFTDLNDACPKDCFPLPRIDTLIDATAGHEMLSFMGGFSG